MKLLAILFILVAWTVVKGLIVEDASGVPVLTFPTFETPSFAFQDLSGGCGSFTDCIEFVGYVLYNIGLGIIFLVLFFIELITYVFELFALIFQIQFTGVEGAPDYVNVLLALPFIAGIALIVFKMARSGETEA